MGILTAGAIERIRAGNAEKRGIFQVLNATEVKDNRVKLTISDSVHSHTAVLSDSLHRFFASGALKPLNLINIKEMIVNGTGGRMLFIIVDLEPFQTYTKVIGNPIPYVSAPSTSGQLKSKRVLADQKLHTGPVVKNQNSGNFTPIRGLNPYSSKWRIQCRVTSKSTVRTWDKGPSNQGKLFSVTLLDKEDTEIKATFFRDAVDRFFDFLELQKVYSFSNGQVKLANKKYNSTNCDYELTFSANAEIVPEHNNEIKTLTINPISIKSIDPNVHSVVDVCAAIMEWSNVENFTSRAGREITKLELQLVDISGASVRCTVFGEKCSELETQLKLLNAEYLELPVQNQKIATVAIKGVKVSDFNGCSLSLLPSSDLFVDPDIPEKQQLIKWLRTGVAKSSLVNKSNSGNRNGSGTAGVNLNERRTLRYIDELEDINDDKGEYFYVKGTISMIRKNTVSYPACPDESSNKKVIQQADGSYYCEATGKSYQHCQHRYILNLEIADHTGSLWVTVFNDEGEKLIGMSANDLEDIRTTNEEAFESALLNATFEEWMFRLRVKSEMYNDEGKKRCTVLNAEKVNFDRENQQLNEYISQF